MDIVREKDKVAIVIITYNIDSRIFNLQQEAIRKFCKDDYQIIIVDNSTDARCVGSVAHYCNEHPEVICHKTSASSKDGSDSHAFAANFIMNKIKESYGYYFYLDHDCIPVKPFSVVEILKDKVCAGLGQQKSKKYFWAGCFMYNALEVHIPFSLSPSRELKLDTGGETYRLIEAYDGRCGYFDELHVQNPDFNKSMYNFYAMIYNGTFMHYINASNWNKSENNEERLSSLLNITENKIKENGNV